jgi:predicted O-methyltransferase YrrM
MQYAEFLRRFGGAMRTKNLDDPANPDPAKAKRNPRPYRLPTGQEIPAEFIRLDPWEGEYLFMAAARARQGIVEIGRMNGGSAFLMACANPAVPIHSIDISPPNDDRLRGLMASSRVGGKVNLITADSRGFDVASLGAYDLLFIDGDHSYNGCLADLKRYVGGLTPGGHVVLHDYYHGCAVMDAVLDFCDQTAIQLWTPRYISHEHWWQPAGSMAHLILPG